MSSFFKFFSKFIAAYEIILSLGGYPSTTFIYVEGSNRIKNCIIMHLQWNVERNQLMFIYAVLCF